MIQILPSSDPAVPDRSSCVLGEVLTTRAHDHPHKEFAVFEDGHTWTYADTLHVARGTAAALQSFGVAAGDRVLSWLPNGQHALKVWFGANLAGATYVPINTSYRGRVLEHVVANSGAEVAVVHAQLVDRLSDIDAAMLRSIVVVGDDDPSLGWWSGATYGEGTLDGDAGSYRPSAEPVEPWDTQSIIYTSGTTGPSKGVLSSHVHAYTTVAAAFEDKVGPADRYLINLPLFHAGGTIGVFGMLVFGGSIAVVSDFDTSSFWDVVRGAGVTSCTLLGVMATFLSKQPPADGDADNPLQTAYMVPLTEDATEFSERFGVDIYTMFNMTEVACPIVSERNPTVRGTCGTLRPGVTGRLVDEHDCVVKPGEIGELILRSERPWSMNHGYNAMPEATAAAWRNGWFHTGDAFRQDHDGNFFFVDRMKDAIRRRGENVSSFEVEAEVLAHPAVREVAVVAVPSEHGEDEVLAVVAPVPGHDLDPAELLEFLIPRMAHFMVPRYVSIVDDLPKTPTNKVQKHLLRDGGITDDTWDREAAGIRVKRERLA